MYKIENTLSNNSFYLNPKLYTKNLCKAKTNCYNKKQTNKKPKLNV